MIDFDSVILTFLESYLAENITIMTVSKNGLRTVSTSV